MPNASLKARRTSIWCSISLVATILFFKLFKSPLNMASSFPFAKNKMVTKIGIKLTKRPTEMLGHLKKVDGKQTYSLFLLLLLLFFLWALVSFAIVDNQMFWLNDRMDRVENAIHQMESDKSDHQSLTTSAKFVIKGQDNGMANSSAPKSRAKRHAEFASVVESEESDYIHHQDSHIMANFQKSKTVEVEGKWELAVLFLFLVAVGILVVAVSLWFGCRYLLRKMRANNSNGRSCRSETVVWVRQPQNAATVIQQ